MLSQPESHGPSIAATRLVPVGDVFVWQVRSFTVRLSLPVIDRLRVALSRMPASEEHGGILLGRALDSATVEITGLEFFPSAHRKGTLYDLGARERERVCLRARELRRQKMEGPVGYFRTHQRPGLFLDQDDFALMEEAFREPGSVAMLVRPRLDGPPDAGFFFWENGDIDRKQTQLLFPFDTEMLRAGGAIDRADRDVSPAAPAAARLRAFSWSSYQPALLWSGVAVLSFAIVAALLGVTSRKQRGADNPFDLKIERHGQSLLVDWNRNAAALRNVPAATLVIDDGGNERRVTLDRAELEHGSVQFWPQSRRVTVRMDVTNSREISESVTAVMEAARNPATEPAKPTPYGPPPAASPQTPPLSTTPEVSSLNTDTDQTVLVRPRPPRIGSRPSGGIEPALRGNGAGGSSTMEQDRPPVSIAAEKPPAESPAPADSTPPPSAPPPKTIEHVLAVSVQLEPKPPSELRRVMNHVPLFGHIGAHGYRPGDDFRPPEPARSLEPGIPAYMVDNLKQPLAVDVMVSVDKSGHVKNTEVTEGAGTGFGALAADRAASVTWQPAYVGDKPVASQVIAHFVFRKVDREVAETQNSSNSAR